MKRLSKLFSRTNSTEPSKPVASSSGSQFIQKPLPALPSISSSTEIVVKDYQDSDDISDSESEEDLDYYAYFKQSKPQSLFSAKSRAVQWSLPLPQDIIFEMLDSYFYYGIHKPDLRTLFALARTARCLTFYCRSLIYRSINIGYRTKTRRSLPLHYAELICYCPEVAEFVRTIRIEDTGKLFHCSVPLPEDEQCLSYILRHGYPNIRRMELSFPIMWILLPTTLQDAFQTCFRSPTLCEISITRGRIPASLFQSFIFLEDLDIRCLVSYPDDTAASTHDTCAPRILRIIDFTDEGETLENLFHDNTALSFENIEDCRIHTSAKFFHLLGRGFKKMPTSLVALTLHAASWKGATRVSLSQLRHLRALTLRLTSGEWTEELLATLHSPSTLETLSIFPAYDINYRPIDRIFAVAFEATWPRLQSVCLQFTTQPGVAEEELIRRELPSLDKANVLRIVVVDPDFLVYLRRPRLR
ncbi:hypothetical protein CPB83DRAFT_843399 [Crepidotus variabilis]|uniref:Uncharacterized protein n=1 Tax=Crepidotus variabilis TaxID=179855 RepID=A0A9P6ETN0_9AGAR|nr:hypothetical protein CPB83DRAFT_843399 [Crepidotus variabilis]